MKNKADHYCGNYMAARPFTLKLEVRAIESRKDRLYACNDNRDSCNADTCGNDCVADT